MSDQLTDAHYDWAAKFCGVPNLADQSVDPNATQPNPSADPGTAPVQTAPQPNQSIDRDADQPNQSINPSADQSNQPIDPDASQPNQSIDPGAGQPNQSVDPNAGPLNQDATGQTQSDSSSGLDHFLKDAGSVIAGAAVHAVAGAVPLGFLGAGATDAVVGAEADPEEKYWYGVGSTAAGVFDMAAGVVEVAGGAAAAPVTGGLSLAVAAEGVNEIVAGAEAVTAGSALMQQGKPQDNSGDSGGGSDGGDDPPDPNSPYLPRKAGGLEWTEPQTLAEQQALNDAKAGGGVVEMDHSRINDPKYADPGWVKKRIFVEKLSDGNQVDLHYMSNETTGEIDQTKFVANGPEPGTVSPYKAPKKT
jgi:hypothetical protein